jgi:hypothetical protein
VATFVSGPDLRQGQHLNPADPVQGKQRLPGRANYQHIMHAIRLDAVDQVAHTGAAVASGNTGNIRLGLRVSQHAVQPESLAFGEGADVPLQDGSRVLTGMPRQMQVRHQRFQASAIKRFAGSHDSVLQVSTVVRTASSQPDRPCEVKR